MLLTLIPPKEDITRFNFNGSTISFDKFIFYIIVVDMDFFFLLERIFNIFP